MTAMPTYQIPEREKPLLDRVSAAVAASADSEALLRALREIYTDEENKSCPNALAITEKYLFRACERHYFAPHTDADAFFFDEDCHDRVMAEALAQAKGAEAESALAEAAALIGERRFGEAGDAFRRAALLGSENGALNYGVTLSKGDGVAADELTAGFFYWLAARRGNTKAMMYLALNYRKGEGVHKDGMSMVYWYTRAAMAGNNEALLACASCLTQGIGVPNLQEVGAKLLSAAMKLQNKENVRLVGEILNGLCQALEPMVYNR